QDCAATGLVAGSLPFEAAPGPRTGPRTPRTCGRPRMKTALAYDDSRIAQLPSRTDSDSRGTNKTLDRIRTELLAAFSPAERASYNQLVAWLRNTDVASRALKAGDAAPDFLLPDADGRLHSSEEMRRNGPLVVSFLRGGWC